MNDAQKRQLFQKIYDRARPELQYDLNDENQKLLVETMIDIAIYAFDECSKSEQFD